MIRPTVELVTGAVSAGMVVAVAEGLWRRRRRRVRVALGFEASRSLPPREAVRGGLVVAAAALVGGVLMTPIGGAPTPSAPPAPGSPRADVVLALDVSRSMGVADVAPSRWEAARTAALAVAASARDSRVGVVAFAADAHVLLPPTTDHALTILYLNALDPDVTTAQGSNLAGALDAAVGALRADPSPSGVRREVVLFTDGEGFQDAPALDAAVDRARRAGATVSAIMLGTEAGGAVPGVPGASSSASTTQLWRMARATGGRVVSAHTTGVLGAEVRNVVDPRPTPPLPATLPKRAALGMAGLALVLLLSEAAMGASRPEDGP